MKSIIAAFVFAASVCASTTNLVVYTEIVRGPGDVIKEKVTLDGWEIEPLSSTTNNIRKAKLKHLVVEGSEMNPGLKSKGKMKAEGGDIQVSSKDYSFQFLADGTNLYDIVMIPGGNLVGVQVSASPEKPKHEKILLRKAAKDKHHKRRKDWKNANNDAQRWKIIAEALGLE